MRSLAPEDLSPSSAWGVNSKRPASSDFVASRGERFLLDSSQANCGTMWRLAPAMDWPWALTIEPVMTSGDFEAGATASDDVGPASFFSGVSGSSLTA